MQQVLFRIPLRIPGWLPDGIPIYGFGLMLFVAFVVCTWLASRRCLREGIRRDILQDLAIWIFIGGIVGARVAFLIAEHESPWLFFRIWDGGLVLYGSVVGGALAYLLAYWFQLRRLGISTLRLADAVAPSIAVGIALGRIGCFLNGCCFGSVACPECTPAQSGWIAWHDNRLMSSFPFSSPPRFFLTRDGYQSAAGFTMSDSASDDRTIGVVNPDSPAGETGLKPGDIIVKAAAFPTTSEADEREIKSYGDLYDFLTRQWPRGKNSLILDVKRGGKELSIGPFAPKTLGLHPTQLFESISMLLVFFLLTAYMPFRKRSGEAMLLLIFCYGLQRYFNEMLRNDPRPVGFEKYVSLLLVVVGIAGWIWLRYLTHHTRLIIPKADEAAEMGVSAN